MPATTPDAIVDAFIAILKPGGTPVGTIGAVVKDEPDNEYSGVLPILEVRTLQNTRGRAIVAGGLSLGKMDSGFVEATYRDASLQQQLAADPTMTVARIRAAMVVNRDAIVAAIEADPSLGGAVTIAGESITEMYSPDGDIVLWQLAPYFGFALKISYMGSL